MGTVCCILCRRGGGSTFFVAGLGKVLRALRVGLWRLGPRRHPRGLEEITQYRERQCIWLREEGHCVQHPVPRRHRSSVADVACFTSGKLLSCVRQILRLGNNFIHRDMSRKCVKLRACVPFGT